MIEMTHVADPGEMNIRTSMSDPIDGGTVWPLYAAKGWVGDIRTQSSAELICASWNAIVSAAQELKQDPLELAVHLQDGHLVSLLRGFSKAFKNAIAHGVSQRDTLLAELEALLPHAYDETEPEHERITALIKRVKKWEV